MSTALPIGFERLAERFAALREALEAIPSATERAIARNAVRNALDRDAAELVSSSIYANSFALSRILHQGPDFSVLLVRQRDLGTLHALKTLRPDRGSDPLLRRLLLREARHQARIQHAACLPLECALRLEDGRPALLTPYVEAPTLHWVLAGRLYDEARGVELGIRLAQALDAVHSAGLVHGDLTPGNVFVPGSGPVGAILFDFGLSSPLETEPYPSDIRRAYSPSFAAPEASDGIGTLFPAADLFSLGRILSHACEPERSSGFTALLARLQGADPSARGESARSLAAELQELRQPCHNLR